MKTTTREFAWTLTNGSTAKLVGTYVSKVEKKILDADGFCVDVGIEVSHYGSDLVAYVDGKRVDSCWDPAFWRLIDSRGAKKIWGLKVGFASEEISEKYNAFLNDLMQEDDEVMALRAEEKRKQVAEDLKMFREIVRWCEQGYIAETEAEAKEKWRRYNDINNDGGYGYVPTWYTRAQYEEALAFIVAHDNEEDDE